MKTSPVKGYVITRGYRQINLLRNGSPIVSIRPWRIVFPVLRGWWRDRRGRA